MPGNTFGRYLRITTFGESHGEAVGVIIDGMPAGFTVSLPEIQKQMDRRKPGQSDITTPRKEADEISILSGVFENMSTGTPITLILHNTNTKSGDYSSIKDKFRPGHADFTYNARYGIRDYRGGGRSSGRETAARVAAGALARAWLLEKGVKIQAYVTKAAGVSCKTFDIDVIEKNPLRACDADAAQKMIAVIKELAEKGESSGGIVECRIDGVPPGLGDPVFDRLEADLAKAALSIGAVKGFEIGSGFACADMTGSSHNDPMTSTGFLKNDAGGVLGGISNGERIVFRIPVKPTSSIPIEQQTVDIHGNDTTIQTHGRHDPVIAPRIVPVIEAMSALVIMDHWLSFRALNGREPG